MHPGFLHCHRSQSPANLSYSTQDISQSPRALDTEKVTGPDRISTSKPKKQSGTRKTSSVESKDELCFGLARCIGDEGIDSCSKEGFIFQQLSGHRWDQVRKIMMGR